MKIYIDADFKCHTVNDGTMRELDVSFFDNTCPEWIESYRYVPAGETWVREDGVMFTGEMVSPWKDLSEAYIAQTDYLEQQTAQYEAAFTEIEAALGVTS
mgnify:CR=1 FL=1